MIDRLTSLAESQRGVSRLRSQFCYNSFLAVAAELHRKDTVYVVASPCSSIKRAHSATQFGIFRIR